MNRPSTVAALAIASALGLAATSAARADSDLRLPRDTPEAYRVECASCHIAYAPSMLPARSWQRLMSDLSRHYGSDATLDARTVAQLDTWLQANAGSGKHARAEPPQDRITRSAWFERKHRKVDAAVWPLASVKSAANCGACHSGADRGDYDDDRLRFPAGLDARQRRAWQD
jgi:hypothetical protein